MDVATRRAEVGIRELKNGLSKYIDRVRAGEEVIVTDRGRPVARLSSIDASEDRLADLVAAGVVRPPVSRERHVPERRIKAKAPGERPRCRATTLTTPRDDHLRRHLDTAQARHRRGRIRSGQHDLDLSRHRRLGSADRCRSESPRSQQRSVDEDSPLSSTRTPERNSTRCSAISTSWKRPKR